MLLLLPLNLILSIMIAAAIHEACHIMVLQYFRIPILRIELGIGGTMIQTGPLSLKEELICAAAGPCGSFLCIAFLRQFPLLGLCGLVQGLFNLLPIYPMDGGRILRCFCLYLCPVYASAICLAIAWGAVAVITVTCLWLSLHTNDIFYILLPLYFLLCRRMERKIPCKEYRY